MSASRNRRQRRPCSHCGTRGPRTRFFGEYLCEFCMDQIRAYMTRWHDEWNRSIRETNDHDLTTIHMNMWNESNHPWNHGR